MFSWLRGESEASSEFGYVTYSNGQRAVLSVSPSGGVEYGITINPQPHIQGISIPSHRVASRYQQIGSIPTTGIGAAQAFHNYYNEQMNRYVHGNAHSGVSPMFRMKEALISMATFGAGNDFVRGRPDLLKSYLGFIEVLRAVLPSTLGFSSLEIRTPDVVLITRSGEFLLDSVSGGVGAVIDLAWQIFTYSDQVSEFVVVIDEPENHLHPSMQRELLPNLLKAFPTVQFVVATHSPFIVTAVRDSVVNVLAYRNNKMEASLAGLAPELSVYSRVLDHVNKAGSANEVLRDVLGLDTTIPVWASHELQATIDKFRGIPLTEQVVRDLDKDLAERGLSDFLPDAVDGLSTGRKS
ncbi:ATP-binding protein [Xanthomonas campestris]|uniref:AAA family ATPase n=1 Tax=Xanthomonas campestris TaxID=339 RepID=UPI001E4884AC|nr:AAA family ATPase [Xanthomonas campestris]MCC5068824.1 ATP-binding protein [Xanthomonas campestris]MEB1554493.1 AAA family ATPase [Xanthomonas campestris pv. campestris]